MNRRLIRDNGVDYRIANSVWYRKKAITLRKSFLRKIAGYFGAEVYSAPFNAETVSDINKWVSNHTEGKIPSIIDKLSRDDRVVAINALYFNGKWAKPYLTDVKKTFTLASGKEVKVPMLEGTESEYVRVNGGDGFLKYYKGGSVAFLGLLPPKGTSVQEYVKGLSGKEFIDAYRNRSKATVYTRMPKFGYSYSTSLEPVLKKLGVKSMFSRSADFSNMTETAVSVDKILHKTFIRVDQEGTEAAAVTAILMDASAVYDPDRIIKKVYLNRPFVYGLIDTKTGIPLFLGCVKDPS
jgi:serpin B